MKTKIILAALFAALSFTSCANLEGKQNVPQQVKHLDNEKVIKQSLALKDFHAISNAIGIDVYYTQSPTFKVFMEGTEQCMAQAKLEVTDGVLNITNRYKDFCNTSSDNLKIYISAPSIDQISNQGSMDFYGEINLSKSLTISNRGSFDYDKGTVKAAYVSIDNNGSLDMDIPMQIADSLRINNFGSFDINDHMNIAGSVHINNKGSFDIDKIMHITGSAFINNYGSFDGSFGLKGRDFEVSNYGSFDSYLKADCDHIKVNSFGSTDMDITGTTKQISINDKGVTDIDTTQLKVLK